MRVEFEFRSRCFRDHDPAGCELIVCRQHVRPDCPLEVLTLKSAIADLPAAG